MSQSVSTEEVEAEVALQKDRLYGVALFFECISLLYAGQEHILATYRRQFRNLIQEGSTAVAQAEDALAAAKSTAGAPENLALPGQLFSSHQNPQDLISRADAILAAYKTVFPGRDRSKEFDDAERLQLIDAAASAFEGLAGN